MRGSTDQCPSQLFGRPILGSSNKDRTGPLLPRFDEAIDLFRECWKGMASVCADRPNMIPTWGWSRNGFGDGIQVLRKLGRDEEAIQW
jgi:hypothetical protein